VSAARAQLQGWLASSIAALEVRDLFSRRRLSIDYRSTVAVHIAIFAMYRILMLYSRQFVA
jgi:hypothetical protein